MLSRINYLILLIFVFLCSCSNDQSKKQGESTLKGIQKKMGAQDGKAPIMEFIGGNLVNLGKIKEGEKITHTYEFKNTGNAPLQISYANASCGCTVPSWPKEEIPVGGKSAITVEFNSKNKEGKMMKNISIYANTNPEFNNIAFNVEVIK